MPSQQASKPPVLMLMGPTASGKSALAVALAQSFNAEIISVDSALVYRQMDIGTAKPSLAERGGITHHLLDILDPAESYSTGSFRTQALALIADIQQRGKLPLLVGGTMLYFNALNHGLAELPHADVDLRQQLEEDFARDGKLAMHQRLAEIDPVSAARIHPHDPQRIQRALEVYLLTGQTLTELVTQSANNELAFTPIKMILAPTNRDTLHKIIAQRFHTMLSQGLLEEVQALWQRGDLNLTMPALRAVGYRQVWLYLQGELSYAEMTEKAIIATRQLAKRQFTWLRREVDAKTFSASTPELLNNASHFLRQKMAECANF